MDSRVGNASEGELSGTPFYLLCPQPFCYWLDPGDFSNQFERGWRKLQQEERTGKTTLNFPTECRILANVFLVIDTDNPVLLDLWVVVTLCVCVKGGKLLSRICANFVSVAMCLLIVSCKCFTLLPVFVAFYILLWFCASVLYGRHLKNFVGSVVLSDHSTPFPHLTGAMQKVAWDIGGPCEAARAALGYWSSQKSVLAGMEAPWKQPQKGILESPTLF